MYINRKFLYSIEKVPEMNNVHLIDTPGFNDTHCDMLEFTNIFIKKKLFNSIKKLKILIPFTADSITNSRGALMI